MVLVGHEIAGLTISKTNKLYFSKCCIIGKIGNLVKSSKITEIGSLLVHKD